MTPMEYLMLGVEDPAEWEAFDMGCQQWVPVHDARCPIAYRDTRATVGEQTTQGGNHGVGTR